jgi:antirestriction protein ArdC
MYMPLPIQRQRPSATAKEEAPMNSQAAPITVTPSTSNPKEPQQRQTAKEVIAANVKRLIEQLEAGHSDALTAYLDAMSRFHNYSFGNILEIARQKPTATRVAGLYAWNQLGRKVRKGEHGIRILAPIIGIKRKKDEEAEKDITKQNTRVLVGFRNAYVFDVSQTDGAELPAMREINGDVGENRDSLVSFIKAQGIELVFTENIAPALGVSYGGRIAILPGQSKAEEFSTLVHELAHEMLHKAERRTTTTKVVKETEAEAIAFVVAKAVGLETGTASADYIHLYHGNASLLAESLEVIQQTSAVILAALQPPTTEQAAMPDAELAKVA